MQQVPFLQTKLYIPPIRSELVSRPRLIERLNAGLGQSGFQESLGFGRKLTVISAPAGFGKTTLASEWVHVVRGSAPPIAVAWLSLDEGDNDLARFLVYLIAALRAPVLPVPSVTEGSGAEGAETRRESVGRLGKGALSALHSPQPPPTEAVLTSLINDLTTIPGRMILVLDDYHLIEAQAIHDALSFLLEHLPPPPGGIPPSGGVPPPGGMHLVITTREDPPLPLARLRAQGQLTEVRATDLRFTLSEAAEFLNQAMGLDLSAEDTAALERRTEGWIAGLQMAALALQGIALQDTLSVQGHTDTSSLIRSFTGSHRFVLDYLIEEVFEQQSESIQAFLLQTAILDRLTGPLCDAVRFGGAQSPSIAEADAVRFSRTETRTDQDNGRANLERMERANLFVVPLDEERRWYRYHHLFSDLLRRRLRQTQPEWVPTLHLRASEWYAQNGFGDEAIEHALRAEEFERAAYLLEEHADALWGRGGHTQLRDWLAKLPLELVCSKPNLCIYHAWYLFVSGQQDTAERTLQAAKQALDSSTNGAKETEPQGQDFIVGADGLKLRGRMAAVRAFMVSYRGDVPGIIRHASQALEYLPEQDRTWRGICAMALGDAHGFKGDMAAAYAARSEALKACQATGDIYYVMLAGMKLAITLRAQGRLRQTLELVQEQIQLANEYGLAQTSLLGLFLAIQAEVLAEFNDLDGAIEQANRGMLLAEHAIDLAILGWGYMCLLRILYSGEDYSAINKIVEKMEATARESNVPTWIMSQMGAWQARSWLAQGKLEEAYQWARAGGLIAAGKPKPPRDLDFFSLMEYIVLARILIAQKRLAEATDLLQPLLKAAEAGDRTTRVIEILNLQALTFQTGGESTQALTTLERALTLAEPEGFVRIFVDEGPPMANLLHQATARGMMPGYTARLLASFESTDDGPQTTRHSSAADRRPSDLVEPLSEREIEVLQLIAEGLTNREIAARLYLSLNTVKAHTRNIYGKLDVHSRTQAIARAKAWRLLPSE